MIVGVSLIVKVFVYATTQWWEIHESKNNEAEFRLFIEYEKLGNHTGPITSLSIKYLYKNSTTETIILTSQKGKNYERASFRLLRFDSWRPFLWRTDSKTSFPQFTLRRGTLPACYIIRVWFHLLHQITTINTTLEMISCYVGLKLISSNNFPNLLPLTKGASPTRVGCGCLKDKNTRI